MLSMSLFFVACGPVQTEKQSVSKEEQSNPPTQHSQNTIEEEMQTTLRLLSAYDGNIDCEHLPKKDRQSTLTYIIDNVSLPPWAPMRAATCLTRLYPEESEEEMIRWVENPKTKGLAFLLTKQMNILPKPVALRVTSAGLKGPFAEDFRARLIKINDVRLIDVLKQP
jgi:hypothetical protein